MSRLPKLDARLKLIAEMVRPKARCADIGTDHGYLITWLCASGKIPSGYACDIHQKPLEKAAFSLKEYGVSDCVQLILSDGLSGLHEGDVDDIVIAGMGGDLIWEILCAAKWTRNPSLHFLLQPMTKAEHLRKQLWENGFAIVQEKPVVSGGFPYSILEVVYTGGCRSISMEEAYVGSLLESMDLAAQAYCTKAARLLREKVEGMEKAVNPPAELAEYRAVLERLEGRGEK